MFTQSKKRGNFSFITMVVILLALLAGTERVLAHCDGMDGPVVKAARRALESENVNLILIWVQKGDEDEIKRAFQKTLAVRKLSPDAKDLADRYFFETIVRIHRAGEGAPYTGLKPAGRDLGPAIPAADKAIEDGSIEPLQKLLASTVQEGVRKNFKEVIAKRNFSKDDVTAGREYVEAYVEFIHFIERIYEASANPAHGHYTESGEDSMPKEGH